MNTEDKGKKGTMDGTKVVSKGPQSSISPEDGKGGVVSSIKDKLLAKKTGAVASLGDQASNSIKGAMGAIRTAAPKVSAALKARPTAPRANPSPLSKISLPRSSNSGQVASGYAKVDRSSPQPTYGTPLKKLKDQAREAKKKLVQDASKV